MCAAWFAQDLSLSDTWMQVADKQIFARIDRLSRICTFAARKDPNDVLNDWAHDISDLLGKLEKTCHLIHKEQMVHGPKKKGAK